MHRKRKRKRKSNACFIICFYHDCLHDKLYLKKEILEELGISYGYPQLFNLHILQYSLKLDLEYSASADTNKDK